MIVTVDEVRQAIARDELIPNFQPIVALHTGRLTGFEVLARWEHPELGPILPSNFISVAEDNELIGMLMRQVFHKAFAAASQFPDPLLLSVNISPIQMRDPALGTEIRRLADTDGFPLHRLIVEITESALLTDLERAKSIAEELTTAGCKLALDDFGTGYSSLAHLQALPFSELKVDRSFVDGMTRTRESRKIVAAIIGLGNSLGMATVAEGVETQEQADMLLWLGCEQGQGWLYGRPVSAADAVLLIEAPPRPISPRLVHLDEGWASSNLEALPTQRLAQLQAIYDGAPVGLCFVDRQLRYVSINQRLAEMNGSSVEAHLGRTVKELIPESYSALEPYLKRALLGEIVAEVEVTRPPKPGEDAEWIARLSYQPAFDEADEVIGISIAVVDVTELRLAQQALRKIDIQRQAEGSPPQIMPWIMDAEGNNLYTSAQWVQMESINHRSSRNLGWLEALHPDDLEATMKTMKEALFSATPIDIEYRVQNLEGSWEWMRSRGTARLNDSGEVTRWYGIVERLLAPTKDEKK
jgi:PAS domain S-box-containing protein